MSEIEILTTLIGELIVSEISEVDNLEYTKANGKLTAFAITMQNGKQYALEIKEVA
ncbi:MAG: hypothetical protein FWC80_04875 [Firmicutes bacterium]|nr:hypothetical protein [Bacillota bacterium]